MSFVFDQIDAIEKERSEKDETLQRIRSWRESKKEKQPIIEHEETAKHADDVTVSGVKEKGLMTRGVELVHPWPEWIELMERLVQQNYFDCRRKDEDKMISDSGFGDADADGGFMAEVMEEGFDFTRDWKTVQTAGLNFGKDRFDILRSVRVLCHFCIRNLFSFFPFTFEILRWKFISDHYQDKIYNF